MTILEIPDIHTIRFDQGEADLRLAYAQGNLRDAIGAKHKLGDEALDYCMVSYINAFQYCYFPEGFDSSADHNLETLSRLVRKELDAISVRGISCVPLEDIEISLRGYILDKTGNYLRRLNMSAMPRAATLTLLDHIEIY